MFEVFLHPKLWKISIRVNYSALVTQSALKSAAPKTTSLLQNIFFHVLPKSVPLLTPLEAQSCYSLQEEESFAHQPAAQEALGPRDWEILGDRAGTQCWDSVPPPPLAHNKDQSPGKKAGERSIGLGAGCTPRCYPAPLRTLGRRALMAHQQTPLPPWEQGEPGVASTFRGQLRITTSHPQIVPWDLGNQDLWSPVPKIQGNTGASLRPALASRDRLNPCGLGVKSKFRVFQSLG